MQEVLVKNNKLGLVFTKGVSLEEWVNRGLFFREKYLYEKHLDEKFFTEVHWFTYGKEDVKLSEELKAKGDAVSYEAVLENVQKRDKLDTSRADSPLVQAEDAILLDNTHTNIEDQFHILLQLC